MAVTYQGVSISPGAALGRVLVVQENSMELPQYKPVEPAAEIERFRQCHGAAIQETREMLVNFAAHFTTLEDRKSVV